jgi:hypothetical protein
MSNNKKPTLALTQILILIIGIVAVSYAIGSEIEVISSGGAPPTITTPTKKTVETEVIEEDIGPFEMVEETVETETPTTEIAEEEVEQKETTETPEKKEEIEKQDKEKPPIETATGLTAAYVLENLGYALLVYGAINIFGKMFLDDKEVEAAAMAVSMGYFTTSLLTGIEKWGVKEWAAKEWKGLTYGTWAGIGVAVVIFVYMYKKESTKTVTFTCLPWEAPTKGNDCEVCNKQDLPCSEYQCKSLGQSCQLLNSGTENEKCVWVNRDDIKFPIITPWEDSLLYNYKYTPDNTISPPDKGVIVWNKDDENNGCAKAFTPLSFGVILDEPGKCKIDYVRKEKFDDMDFYFGESSLFRYNHTQIMSLPGPSAFASENITIQNDGNFELYVKCQDANGNFNTANFVFKFCVEEGPDTMPPSIDGTSILNGFPIEYGQTSIDIEVYVNEPADCMWSHLDLSYESMENEMICSSSVVEMNAQMIYECSVTLDGLKDRVDNNFYFKCKDQPLGIDEGDRNVNTESYKYTLIGTQPLIIDSAEPNQITIKDSTERVKVTLEAKTSAGYNEGESTCKFSETGEDDYIMFFKTNSYQHSQDLWLLEGDYEYFIECTDLGGNSDTTEISFTVESDTFAPIIVRAFHEETYLRLITDEEAECVYDTVDCSYPFDDGISMNTIIDNTNHYTDWNSEISFYIKCQDKYGKQPMPNECSMIIRPFKEI